MTVSGVDGPNIRQVYAAAVFNYTLDQQIKMDMKSLAQVSVTTPQGCSMINAFGDLGFQQRTPLYSEGFKKTDYDENPLETVTNKTVGDLLLQYEARNETTVFDSNVVIQPSGNPNEITL